MKDIKILNAKIPDFETDGWRDGDILIHDGVIEKVGTVFEDTRETIDVAGKVVSPGFIDIHTHEDYINAGEYDFLASRCELRMGVTTQICGNCGDSYDELGDFIKNIEAKGSPTNYLMFVGQNSLRQMAGADDPYKPSSPGQLDRMKKILSEMKKYHPVGLSCGLEYSPGITAEEVVELLQAFDEEGYLNSIHFRSDGPDGVSSIKEMIDIHKKSGYPLQISHIGSCNAMGNMEEGLRLIRKARAEGFDIMADCYPYDGFCASIGSAVFDDGCFERWGKDYSSILITDGKYRNQYCTKEIFEEVRRENPKFRAIAFVMNEEEIESAFKEPYVMVGSDGGFTEGCGHPRGAGAFPRVISRYVREKNVLTLIEALKKMTVLPAQRVNLKSKGQVKEGFDADLTVFDPKIICDRANFESPTLAPAGIDYVLSGGKIAVKNGEIVNGTMGKYIPYDNRH